MTEAYDILSSFIDVDAFFDGLFDTSDITNATVGAEGADGARAGGETFEVADMTAANAGEHFALYMQQLGQNLYDYANVEGPTSADLADDFDTSEYIDGLIVEDLKAIKALYEIRDSLASMEEQGFKLSPEYREIQREVNSAIAELSDSVEKVMTSFNNNNGLINVAYEDRVKLAEEAYKISQEAHEGLRDLSQKITQVAAGPRIA